MIRVTDDDLGQASLLPDLTPLLDVIFIVMVFLMLSVNAIPVALPVDLPSLGVEQARAMDAPKVVSVNLLPDTPGWAIDGKEYSDWQEFSAELASLHKSEPDRPVMIAGDKSVPMERLVQILSFLQEHQWPAASIQMESDH